METAQSADQYGDLRAVNCRATHQHPHSKRFGPRVDGHEDL